jgi:hypothetical protein
MNWTVNRHKFKGGNCIIVLYEREECNMDNWVFGLFGLCPSSGILVQWLRFALSNGSNRIGAPSLTPEDANRSGLQNVVCFLEYQTLDKDQKFSNPDCNTPSSEPFRIDEECI